ncbi:MAG: prohibitin family protein [Patescibacteria group bacterium]
MKKSFSEMSDGEMIAYIAKRAVIGILVLIFVFGSFGTIGAGERGVLTKFGKVVGTRGSGLYFKLPLIEHMTKMDVHTQSLTATKDAPLSAASNDLQDTRLAVVVNYHIDPTTVENIYQQYGDADTYYKSVVEPLIIATIKATASQYTAAEQIQLRAEMSSKALTALQTAFDGKNVVIEKADITDVAFSDSFTQAIEAKVTAVQQAETAKNKLEQIKFEAQQTIETAKATAEAQRISSQALAAQGGSDYVQLKAIEKWNGQLPVQMIPGSTVPFLNLKN